MGVLLYLKGWLDDIIPVIPSSSGVLCREQTLSSLRCLPQHTFTAGLDPGLEDLEGWRKGVGVRRLGRGQGMKEKGREKGNFSLQGQLIWGRGKI